jgi:hypothetical protein
MNPNNTHYARLTVEDIKALWLDEPRCLTSVGYLHLLLKAMASAETPIRIRPKEFCEKFAISRSQFFKAKAALIREGRITESPDGITTL